MNEAHDEVLGLRQAIDELCDNPKAKLRHYFAILYPQIPFSYYAFTNALVAECGQSMSEVGNLTLAEAAELFKELLETRESGKALPGVVGNEEGVSIRDIALGLEIPEDDIRDCVDKFVNSKRITAMPIGKDPKDKRAKLYRLSEILANYETFSPLPNREKKKLSGYLRAVQRKPEK